MASRAGSCLLAGVALSIVAAAPAAAQNVPVPSVTSVAPTREEINRIPEGTTPRPPSRLTVDGGVERAPCPLADPRFADVTVTLSDVQFDNLRVVSKDVLRPAYADFLGKTVPIAAVCEIRDAAATILRREGYLAAVQVPAQKIANGVVRLDVLMAKLVAIQVRGDAGKSERLIASYLDHLTRAEVFNQKDAERYLLLARDLPGFDVRLTLRPAGTVPGEVIGQVSVIRQPFTIDANIQNYGARSVGRFGGLVRAEAYDVLGLGDRLSLGFFSTADFDEQQVVQGGYEFRLGGEGLTVASRVTYAWTHPDVGTLDLASHTLVASGEVRYPFIRSQSVNLRGAFGFDLIDQDLRTAGTDLSRDRLRVLFLRGEYETVDPASVQGVGGYSVGAPRWRLAGALELRRGLAIFDASDRCGAPPCNSPGPSRVEGDPTATVFRISAEGEFRPVPNIAFVLTPSAQYARHPLFSYEEYSGGNYTVGRGYDPGTIIGDSGIGVQAELRLGQPSPNSLTDLAFQPYAFVDAAWVWNHDSNFDGLNPQRLVSAGGGVRAAYGSRADRPDGGRAARAGRLRHAPRRRALPDVVDDEIVAVGRPLRAGGSRTCVARSIGRRT